MTEINKRLDIIVNSADDKKAFDIKVLDISKLSSIGDYFVILSGNSERQVKSIADEIDDKMNKAGYTLLRKEGHNTARWILLDYADIVVHVFHKEDREFYNLERLWIDAEDVEIEKH